LSDLPQYRSLLPSRLAPPSRTARHLVADHERFADAPYPVRVDDYVRERYAIDLAASLGPLALRHPIGKASGQLSLRAAQVEADVDADLAFVVLKTVIAESPAGSSRMAAWKIEATRMECERIRSRRGEDGYTISWIGRGWEKDLASYCRLVVDARRIARDRGVVVIPSVKLHLPSRLDEPYDIAEYRHTLAALADAWGAGGDRAPLVVEKDFSPTLAGSDLAAEKAAILRWLYDVPRLVAEHGGTRTPRVGIKVMNALFDDDFQLEMLRALEAARPRPAFLTLFNRLFDPARAFGEHRGIAYGGPDLSDRNLAVLTQWAREGTGTLPISATGNIVDGRLLAEYALRGASSAQIHTFFQLPRACYRSHSPRSRAALHELLFHPATGLLAAMAGLRELAGTTHNALRFLDLAEVGRELLARRDDGSDAGTPPR